MAGDTLRVLLLAVLLAIVAPASAKDYAVGDSSGWKPGVDYTAWAKGKSFNVGDSLSFQYNAAHSVAEVSEADYKACSASNALGSYKDQSTSIPLTKPGTRYFICGAAGHCAAGMKLAITVSDGSSAPATTTTASPTTRSTNSAGSDSDESGATGRAARLATGLSFVALGFAALMG
ncbi:hypothetical protein EJB05_38486 [Eragrostis curvula]|uniref:Phytocyanin domain-containing protein n=1 Tax=Eragrostis curvula TaxID=38414 RepID=A0A5J9TW00_9POAL|nr:hypothetical protein EJB05_38486 [Eragrostis curvula]